MSGILFGPVFMLCSVRTNVCWLSDFILVRLRFSASWLENSSSLPNLWLSESSTHSSPVLSSIASSIFCSFRLEGWFLDHMVSLTPCFPFSSACVPPAARFAML